MATPKTDIEITPPSDSTNSSLHKYDIGVTKYGGDPEKLHIEQLPEPIQTHPITTLFKRKHRNNPQSIATQASVYDDPIQAQYFLPHPKYENLHRFDPSLIWTWEEETVSKQLVIVSRKETNILT